VLADRGGVVHAMSLISSKRVLRLAARGRLTGPSAACGCGDPKIRCFVEDCAKLEDAAGL
jgi:hypothetical protein